MALGALCGLGVWGVTRDACAAPAADTSLSPMRAVIERFATDEDALERRHRLSVSARRQERLQEFYAAQRQALDRMDFDALDRDGQIDYVLLRTRLGFLLKELAHEQRQREEAAPLLPFAEAIARLEETRRRFEPLDPEAAAARVSEIHQQLAEKRGALEKRLKESKAGSADAKDSEGKASLAADKLPDKVAANRAAKLTDELRETLKGWHEFHAGYDPEFTWWLREPYPKLDKALKDYAKFLRQKLAGYPEDEAEDAPIIGNPIGRQALLDALAAEMIPSGPEELIAIAHREFAWCETEQRRAARDLGFGDDWKKALAHVSQLHVKPGGQPRLIKELADEALKFIEDRQLVTVPELCQEVWRMEMMSVERQKVSPYFTGGEVISVSFPTDTMAHEDKLMSLRGNNVHFSRATVHHELIPGHHLQGFMAQRHRTHRRAFRTPFLVEGWALYWEMRLWDLGFPKSAEDRVGFLFWRSHRCARIIFSLKFHLGQMTAQEAVDFLVDRVGHERRNATAEVRRSFAGGYGPLYQAAYMLGGLQLRALHRELVGSGQMTERDFHDAVLRENAIPIELIRASLTSQRLTRDFATQWRFYELK
jgi:uncharacterized protein (DUF885 family)